MRREEFIYFVNYRNEATNMKLFITIIISLIVISFTAQSAKVKSLIVAEYRKDGTGLGNYSNLVSYNFLDGKLISNDTIFGAPTFKENGRVPYVRFNVSKNFIYKNRYVVSGRGNVIDLDKKTLVNDNSDEYIAAIGDTLIFWRYNDKNQPEYLYLNLLNERYKTTNKIKSKFVKGLISPNYTHSLVVERFVPNPSIRLYNCFNKLEIIVQACGSGTTMSEYSSVFPEVPLIWISDSVFVYAYFKKNSAEIRKVNIFTKSNQEIVRIDSIPDAMSNAEFKKDANDNIVFHCTKGPTAINLNYNPDSLIPYTRLGNQFEIEIRYDKRFYKIKYKNEIIGELWCNSYSARTIEGYFATDFENNDSEVINPKGFVVWNDNTKEWNKYYVPNLCSIIGWIEEE